MSFNDYIVASNNSINENKLNAKKGKSTMYQFKKITKSFLQALKKNNKNTYKKSPEPTFYNDEYDSEIDDNCANEILENEIFEDIDSCEEFSGVQVYQGDNMDVVPVYRGQRYIPVHFARTDAGTFFWSSMITADADINTIGDDNAICQYQKPEMQVDRWAQA
ncbi:enhancer of split malpha protein-like [Aethina tumida]|uniref:enhancer of split malpha protein-like n=1 Tax=Aethina tumida TaxID=116153 RepID=UPI00096B6745|nr:enhancer of split malpha protein-like [Aethina tumida]